LGAAHQQLAVHLLRIEGLMQRVFDGILEGLAGEDLVAVCPGWRWIGEGVVHVHLSVPRLGLGLGQLGRG